MLHSTRLHQLQLISSKKQQKKPQTFKTTEEKFQWMFLVVINTEQLILTIH